MSAIPLHLHFHCAKKMIPAIPHFTRLGWLLSYWLYLLCSQPSS
uniref:Uncharacterized protein n=1 Tax=Anguilla anguilla TaxID=7936 RepID=A0A0E9W016_ANGAN